ncbi:MULTISPECIES: bL17 family ribosomal protein [unclassified Meiothermus]|uniref:bL17 family ribosomal protein n=1 Tax=unclassified Meiothermus TaxID=370471 RepID=UPI000D7BFB4C|nr:MULTISPECIES: L17 family ribosomal protein [unclassified Meiothermus]PZA05702.1 50S ribosomal protein L17 [Meiothermus sp. Pnk-1]RYM30294.1 50S ribosomal protein L17 [Meiothermus sp. PNK-Is4]
MRHLNSGRKLNRHSAHRLALARNQAKALLEHGRITTTVPKAKELVGFVDRLINTAKKAPTLSVPEGVRFTKPLDKEGKPRSLREGERMATPEELKAVSQRNHLRRLLLRDLHDPKLVRKLFDEIAPKYASRSGGYTRVLKLDRVRRGDGTPLALIELVD